MSNQEVINEIPNLTKVLEIINYNQPAQISLSWIQRKFSCGFNSAKVIMHDLSQDGVVEDSGIVNWSHHELEYIPEDDFNEPTEE